MALRAVWLRETTVAKAKALFRPEAGFFEALRGPPPPNPAPPRPPRESCRFGKRSAACQSCLRTKEPKTPTTRQAKAHT